jgi:hypothetical protein
MDYSNVNIDMVDTIIYISWQIAIGDLQEFIQRSLEEIRRHSKYIHWRRKIMSNVGYYVLI